MTFNPELAAIADAALAYVVAAHCCHEAASGPALMDAWITRDWCFHELIQALGLECWICDPGTCPSGRAAKPTYEGRRVEETPPL